MKQWIWIGIATLFLVIGFVACKFTTPSEDDIVGQWVEIQSSCDRRGAIQCASIEFFSDGRFEAQSIPSEYTCYSLTPIEINSDCATSFL